MNESGPRDGGEGRGEPAPVPVPRTFGAGQSATASGAAGVPRALLLRADEVAALLGLGRSKVFEMMAAGELPVIRIGRSVRVPRDLLHQWIEDRTALPRAGAWLGASANHLTQGAWARR